MKKMISFDREALLPLTEERKAELRTLADRLADIPDIEIDFTDNPEITPERWATRLPNPNRAVRAYSIDGAVSPVGPN
jgi:hypothetical protein